jgi:hypothetical protein
MIGKFRKITSLLLLLVFLLPSVVKAGHHHKDYSSNLKNEKNYPVLQDNCPICNFEFSVFLTNVDNTILPSINLIDNYCNNYNSCYNLNLSLYSFLLRAPPGEQI